MEVEVLEGLNDHERVINNPRDNIVDGLRVTAVAAPVPADKSKDKEAPKDARPAAGAKP